MNHHKSQMHRAALCPQFDLATGRRIETDLHGSICLSDAVEQRVHPTHVDDQGWIW